MTGDHHQKQIINNVQFFSFFKLRTDNANYKLERKRQRLWVPQNTSGKIVEIILDPHLRAGISKPQECSLCKINYSTEPIAKSQTPVEFQDSTNL